MLCYRENFPYGLYGLSLINDSTIEKTAHCEPSSIGLIESLVNYLINYPDPMIVPVYSFQRISERKGTVKYRYTMKRLYELTKEERTAIEMMSGHWDDYVCCIHNKYIDSWSESLPHLTKFVRNLSNRRIYWDFHEGNILKDEDENYRVIDLEGLAKNSDLACEAEKWWLANKLTVN